jgi:alanine racemase
LAVPADATTVILEAGISRQNEMQRLEKMIKPEIGIFTNLLSAHAENFESRKEHLEEKMHLFTHCKTLIYCSNYPEIGKLAKQKKIGVFSWGKQADDQVQIRETLQKDHQTELRIFYQGQTSTLIIPAQDAASLENAMHVSAYLLLSGLPADEVNRRIARIQAREMRMETISGIHNCLIINDTWSADMHSLQLALETLSLQAYDKKTLIVSDLPEESNNHKGYQTLAALCNQKGLSRLVGVGEQISKYASLFEMQKNFFLSTEELLEQIANLDFRDECILLKGARIFRFERIAAQLQEKKHETLLEVNLSNLIDNLNYYRGKAGKQVKMMAMVKAFAYGSGSVEIARALQFHGVDYLAVAYADEGVVLRKAGISIPILVLSPEMDSLRTMLEYDLEPEIYSFRVLNMLLREMEISSAGEVTVQIKLDTGMHRLGFDENDLEELILRLQSSSRIRVSGIFSHLAASEDPEEDEFTRLQIKRFKSWSQQIIDALPYPVYRHILNSNGISRFPDAAFEMVRLGIGLYGIGNAGEQRFLKNVSSLKTTVSQIHALLPGETVGYGRKGIIEKPSKIATIPIGYADGFLRRLGNGKAYVLIKGKHAFTIGQICMDMCMVDISEIEGVKEGDEAIVFDNADDIKRLAKCLETIPYELLTGISQRVKRVYIEN